MSCFALSGALSALRPEQRDQLLRRPLSTSNASETSVRSLIQAVRSEGDSALIRFAQDFDRVKLVAVRVPDAALDQALTTVSPDLLAAMKRAARNLSAVARATLPPPLEIEVEPDVVIGRRADPLERVGVYAPGGTAAYPSSVLMGVVPAKAAGVKEVIVCSPPGPSGLPSNAVLAAARLAQADAVYAVGGAGAIAAMAFGTESIAKVQRIVGPGNAWVAEAKRQVAADVGIDSPAGPSELLVIADETASATAVALEMLAQAEHDTDACVVTLASTAAVARSIELEIERLLPTMPRVDIARQSLAERGALLTASIDEAVQFSNEFAPEHLLLALADASARVDSLKHAGTIFVGETASVSFGDYLSGANHVLPTAGHARRSSGLSVLDFVRFTTWQRIGAQGAAALSSDVVNFASSEGLYGHVASAKQWQQSSEQPTEAFAPFRSTLTHIERYVPKRPPMEIDLTDNTNLYGVPPATARSIADFASRTITRYPSPYAEGLRGALAAYAQGEPDNVITGCGSDDVLDALFRAFGNAGERVAFAPPTFGIISSFARANGMVPTEVELTVDAFVAAGAKISYLCSPNNPTGAMLPVGFVESLLERTTGVVVLDEAYIEYAARPSLSKLAMQHPRLVVVRTLSKAFGLAGLRVGWGVAHARVVAEIEKTRGPYKVGGLAERAAIAALTEDLPWVLQRIDDVKQARNEFMKRLTDLGLKPLPSEANFILVPTGSKSCGSMADAMRDHGVSVRAFPALQGIGDALRISVAPPAQMDACLAALKKVFS